MKDSQTGHYLQVNDSYSDMKCLCDAGNKKKGGGGGCLVAHYIKIPVFVMQDTVTEAMHLTECEEL